MSVFLEDQDMFDKLIESGRQGRRRPTGGYLLVASTLYFGVLITGACLTIMWFNPGLAEALEMNALIAPRPPMTTVVPRNTVTNAGSAQAVPNVHQASETVVQREVRADVEVLPRYTGTERSNPVLAVGGHRNIPGGDAGVPGGTSREGDAPPPPPREAAPMPTPVKVVESKSIVSEGVLRGIALNRFTPPYPEIAKKAGIQGQVQVQVLISEDGRVIDATIINGNPLLRNTARDAARRWVFTPTKLSGVPVKVQGILTFDFKLN